MSIRGIDACRRPQRAESWATGSPMKRRQVLHLGQKPAKAADSPRCSARDDAVAPLSIPVDVLCGDNVRPALVAVAAMRETARDGGRPGRPRLLLSDGDERLSIALAAALRRR